MSKKKKKIRVEFRKNRGKRSRRKFSSDGNPDDDVLDQTSSSERMSGKGDLTRKRTVIAEEVEGEDGPRYVVEVDEEACLVGRVFYAIGSNHAVVRTADGDEYECSVRRVLRTLAQDARSVVVVGDRVLFRPTETGQGMIERVERRGGTLSRTYRGKEHVIAANIDQAIIVGSADDPPLKTNLIDRFIASAHAGGIEPVVCINKCDLVDVTTLQTIVGLYAQLGYRVVATSTQAGMGIDSLKNVLADKTSVFTGQSGVGKSSLLNQVAPGLQLTTNEVSADSGKGRHTTRSATLHPLEQGGFVVDTPGIRQLELWSVLPEEVEGYFMEFRPFVRDCRFPDCSHQHETNCGIQAAVERGLISRMRYESYLRMVEMS